MFGTIHLWSHLVLDFWFLEFFKITDSILLLVICLVIFSISSWFSLGRLYISKNLSISFRLSILLVYNWSFIGVYSLWIFFIVMLSVVTSPFSFLILLIWALSLFFLKSPTKGLSILFTFSKNQLLVSLMFSIVF